MDVESKLRNVNFESDEYVWVKVSVTINHLYNRFVLKPTLNN